MSEVTTVIGFSLKCRACRAEFLVDATARRHGDEFTYYFKPGATVPTFAALVGISDGSGDSFRCATCAQPEIDREESR